MNKIRVILISSLVILLIGGLTIYRFVQKNSEQNSLKKSRANSIPVTVVVPKKETFSSKLSVSATLLPEQEIQVTPKVTGRILSLKVDEGNTVRAGQLIAEVDHSEIDAQILQAQAQERVARANLNKSVNGPLKQQILQSESSVRQAEASLRQLEANKANLQRDVENYQTLFNKGIIPQQQLNTSQTQLDVINQQIESAKQSVYSAQQALTLIKEGTRPEDIEAGRGQLDNASSLIKLYKSQLANYRIVSPINGIVTKKLLDAGSLVTTSSPIITISTNVNPDIVLSVPEREIDSIRIGQKVEVKSANNSTKTYFASVTEINPSIDNQTRSLKVKAKFNEKTNLTLGILLNCSILTYEKKNTLVLPSDAVMRNNKKTFVYVTNNDKVIAKDIVIGIQDPDKTEVISGIKETDQVVLKGNTFLTPESKIEIQDESTKKNGNKI